MPCKETVFLATEFYKSLKTTEAVVQSCSVKKVFLETSQNSQENTCARDSGTGAFMWILWNF